MLTIRQQIASYKSTLHSRQFRKTALVNRMPCSQSNDGAIKPWTETFTKQSYNFNTLQYLTINSRYITVLFRPIYWRLLFIYNIGISTLMSAQHNQNCTMPPANSTSQVVSKWLNQSLKISDLVAKLSTKVTKVAKSVDNRPSQLLTA